MRGIAEGANISTDHAWVATLINELEALRRKIVTQQEEVRQTAERLLQRVIDAARQDAGAGAADRKARSSRKGRMRGAAGAGACGAEAAGDDDSDEEEEEAPASAGGAAADDASDDE